MKLTDSEIKAAKPKEKPFTLPDGHGLVLLVQPSGAKWWRYRYRFNGTARMLSIGVYPDVTLKEARNEHAHFKKLLAKETLKKCRTVIDLAKYRYLPPSEPTHETDNLCRR